MAKDESIRLRVSTEQKLRWELTAKEHGLTLTDLLVGGVELFIGLQAQPKKAQLEAKLRVAEHELYQAEAALEVRRKTVAMLQKQLRGE
jgi:hypothetical protein